MRGVKIQFNMGVIAGELSSCLLMSDVARKRISFCFENVDYPQATPVCAPQDTLSGLPVFQVPTTYHIHILTAWNSGRNITGSKLTHSLDK